MTIGSTVVSTHAICTIVSCRYYSTTIFCTIDVSSYVATAILGTINFLTTLLTIFLVDKVPVTQCMYTHILLTLILAMVNYIHNTCVESFKKCIV